MSLDSERSTLKTVTVDGKDSLTELRALRKKARSISRHLKDDLLPFRHADGTYAVHPPKAKAITAPISPAQEAGGAAQPSSIGAPSNQEITPPANVHVTTTCTVLMTLITAHELASVLGEEKEREEALRIFDIVVKDEWSSDGLEKDNAFNKVLVLRLAGFLARGEESSLSTILTLKHGEQTLKQIAEGLTSGENADNFSVQKYPPKAALVYWYVDGVDLLGIDLGHRNWKKLATWAGQEFGRQLAYVASNNAALMDPVSMAMAACVAERLRKIGVRRKISDEFSEALPSSVEINHAISLLFLHQTGSGIWPKYFPLFHFNESDAGANYCFTFELLEALLNEFGGKELDAPSEKANTDTSMFQIPRVLDGIDDAVDWCRLNRLEYSGQDSVFRGWNSGGNLKTLRSGKPESWATAAVHWFLHKLDLALSTAIHRAILDKYVDVRPFPAKDGTGWNKLADSKVSCQGTAKDTAKGVLEEEFINPLSQLPVGSSRFTINGRRSALLFGPPGTAKTTIVRELARSIGWPCVEIRPSNFLKDGLEHIYESADEIFADLMDLSKTVIFFDEMDALVQSRTTPLDVTRQFLTTSMLPKLAELHDHGRVVFFVATNYRATFDEAVIRPGRFDLLLFVGPPSWAEKLRSISAMVKNHPLCVGVQAAQINASVETLRKSLESWATNKGLVDQLQLFTFGEMKSLLEQLLRRTGESSLPEAAAKVTQEDFASAVADWSQNYIVLREPVEEKRGEISFRQAVKNWLRSNSVVETRTEYANYVRDRSASRLQ